MKSIHNILRLANLVLIGLTLLAYLSPMLNPARIWHLTFLGLAYPFLLLGNLFFVGYWAMQRQRYLLFSLGCVLVGAGYLSGFFGWHWLGGGKAEQGEITVMTYNLAGLRGFHKDGPTQRKQKTDELKKLADEAGHPDILCVQESDAGAVVEVLRQVFGLPHYFKEKGTIIFSKYPINGHGIVAFEGTNNSCVWADLGTPGGSIRVYSAHLQSNRLTKTATKIATEGDLREKETWSDIGFVMRRYKQAVRIRAQQARAVAAHLAKSPNKVILCGDLNDTPVSYVYRLFNLSLQDSFRKMGSGIGATFAGRLPGLRIDYVLSDPSFAVLSHEVVRAGLSDHYPVVVRLKP